MKKLFKCICIPLLYVNNNVYTFLSGIAISLATNIFTTICIDDISIADQWNLYAATVSFVLVSALLLFMSAKMAGFQSVIFSPANNFDKKLKDSIVIDATEDEYKLWLSSFLALLLLLIAGICFLAK